MHDRLLKASARRLGLLAIGVAVGLASPAQAIIQYDAPGRITATPPAGPALDAWNLQGEISGFLGTPIAPNLFIAARHIDNPTVDHLSGRSFTIGGNTYVTTDSYNIPNTDLRIHQIGTNSFANFATLYNANASGTEVGRSMIAIGRGTPRGDVYYAGAGNTDPRGWTWGAADGLRSYGTNLVDGIVNEDAESTTDTDYGDLVTFDFAGPGDISYSVGDSSGGLFVIVDGQPQLAGVALGVDSPFATTATGPYTLASIYDARGLYVGDASGLVPANAPEPVPGSSYASRISSNRAAINAIFLATGNAALVPEPTTVATLAAFVLLAGRRRR